MIVKSSVINDSFTILEDSYDVLIDKRDIMVNAYSNALDSGSIFKFEYTKHTEEGNKLYLCCYSPELLTTSRIDFVIIES